MAFHSEDFEIEVQGKTLSVKVHTVDDRTVFQVDFPDRRQRLMLMRMKTYKGDKMWTSIPEGRMGEAQIIGPKIVAYFLSKKDL